MWRKEQRVRIPPTYLRGLDSFTGFGIAFIRYAVLLPQSLLRLLWFPLPVYVWARLLARGPLS